MAGTSGKSEAESTALRGTPTEIAEQIRIALRNGGSAEHASGVQWFFKEEIRSHGWYTAALRRAVRGWRREILREHDFEFLTDVADQMFSGSVLEERVAGVFLLEGLDSKCGDREFKLFEAWLDRISSWADHDALVHDLIAPMMVAKPARAKVAARWAKSPKRWHRRSGLCGANSRGSRENVLPGNRKTL
jgi:DNA alkylation repair enzyme